MEATIFTGWIYDYLLLHAEKVKVAHPVMLRAIAAAKKKNDKIDARKIADCLRCDFVPECHMASTQIRDRRRTLRYRNLVIRQTVQIKNRVSGLLMETGVDYNKRRLHKVGYFEDLMSTNKEVDQSIRPLLKLSREMIERGQKPASYRNGDLSGSSVSRFRIGDVTSHELLLVSSLCAIAISGGMMVYPSTFFAHVPLPYVRDMTYCVDSSRALQTKLTGLIQSDIENGA
jgi:hypothetical protein